LEIDIGGFIAGCVEMDTSLSQWLLSYYQAKLLQSSAHNR